MRFGFSLVILFLLYGCGPGNNSSEAHYVQETDPELGELRQFAEKAARDSLLLGLSQEVLALIKARDFVNISEFIHPSLGIRFSPYGFVDTVNHRHFTRTEFLQQVKENEPVLWGNYDGTGKGIVLTLPAYFDEFVYDVDFLNAEQTSVNTILGHGNSLNNLPKIYPRADFTESHFSGFEEKYGGMDWRSLRLVYQFYQGKPFLVAVVHDQWTI